MLQIAGTDGVSNNAVLGKSRQMQFLRHAMRWEGMEKLVSSRKSNQKRGRGR